MKTSKTNAARILDNLGIEYQLRTYNVDESDLSAESVANKIGLPAARVFKTLVLTGDDGVELFAVLPGDRELDLKELAQFAGHRKVAPLPMASLQAATGYLRGGVTVLGAKKQFPVFADSMILEFNTISISAGKRGVQLLLKPTDFVRVTKARVGRIAVQETETPFDRGT